MKVINYISWKELEDKIIYNQMKAEYKGLKRTETTKNVRGDIENATCASVSMIECVKRI